MAAEHSSSSSLPPYRKPRKKKIRLQQEQELERFDSLPWTSALPENDAFSLFSGATDLDGGFLSLEEIDESQYGLEITQPEVISEAEEESEKLLKKRAREEEDDNSKSKKKSKKNGKKNVDKLNDVIESSEKGCEGEEKRKKEKNDKRKERANKLKLAEEEKNTGGGKKTKKKDAEAIQIEESNLDVEENGEEEKKRKKEKAKEKETVTELTVLEEGVF